MDFCYAIEQNMHEVGVDILTLNAEYGAGQLEITWAPKFGVDAGDAASTFRTGVKEMAISRDLRATFMTRPFGVKGVGNGGHFNFSLWQRGSSDSKQTSDINLTGATEGKQFLAGILSHAPALEAFCSPTPPCYTRHGNWAPTTADYGVDNRVAAVR